MNTKPKSIANLTRIWIATMDTRHFSFTATGFTRQEAQEAIVKGWAAHRKQAGADFAKTMPAADIHVLDTEFGINYMETYVGHCFRDYESLNTN